MKRKIAYYFNSDSVCLNITDDESYTDKQELQDGVTLYKNDDGTIVHIEISGFSSFKKDKVKIAENEFIDLSIPLRKVRMALSLSDIMFSEDEDEQQEFDTICKQWHLNITPADVEEMKELIDNQLNSKNKENPLQQ